MPETTGSLSTHGSRPAEGLAREIAVLLRNVVETGDIESVIPIIEKLSAYPEATEQLKALHDNFDFDGMIKFCSCLENDMMHMPVVEVMR